MKNLPIKLGLFLAIVFGLVLLGMLLYNPFWWLWYESKLKSDDNTDRKAAIEIIGSKGNRAIPYVRRWLKSDNERLFDGACQILASMEDDAWTAVLPEITDVLHEEPSERTSKVAQIVSAIDRSWEFEGIFNFKWKRFSGDACARRNICIYLLEDSSHEVRKRAVRTLGRIGDECSFKPLIRILESDPRPMNRGLAAGALCRIGNPDAVEPLIKVLKNDKDAIPRSKAIGALGKLGDPRAISPIINALENDYSFDVRRSAAYALGRFDNDCVIQPLIKSMRTDRDILTPQFAIITLSKFDNEIAVNALKKESKKRPLANAALAWRYGGDYLISVKKNIPSLPSIREFYNVIFARWGDVDELGKMISSMRVFRRANRYFHVEVFKRMPADFPVLDTSANLVKQEHQLKTINDWYKEHKDRIKWNPSEMKYYMD